MNRRPILLVAAGLVLAGLVWAGTVASAPASEPSAPAESLALRSAKAKLRLAELNLKRVQRSNQRVAGAVPADIVAEYRQDVDVAKARVEIAAKGQENTFPVWLLAAEAAAKAAEARWQSARAANQRQPGTVDDLDLDRLKARVEIAQLAMLEGRTLADKPAEAQLQWQVNFLKDEVARLQDQVLRNPPVGRSYPYWPYWRYER
jgi:hypothetical protein